MRHDPFSNTAFCANSTSCFVFLFTSSTNINIMSQSLMIVKSMPQHIVCHYLFWACSCVTPASPSLHPLIFSEVFLFSSYLAVPPSTSFVHFIVYNMSKPSQLLQRCLQSTRCELSLSCTLHAVQQSVSN